MEYSYDLHIHTALSPCGDEDNTPNNVVRYAALLGLDIIAVSDHNSVGNARACIKVAEEVGGILVLPALELTTSEEIHVLCIFPDVLQAESFGKVVRERQMKIKNKSEVFGRQLYLDENDEIVKEESDLLIVATDVGVYETASLASKYGGVAVPAHIDKPSNSLLAILGELDEFMGFGAVELSKTATPDMFKKYEELGYRTITDSDAHRLEEINEPINKIELPKLTPEAVIAYLSGIRRG